jgi:spore germination protein KB
MNEQKLSTRQAVSLATMHIIGQTFVMNNGSPADSDIWISLLAAYTASIPLSLLCVRLTNVFPGKNLYDLQLDLFGPVIGRITALLNVAFALHIGSLVLRGMTNFLQITSLANTPQYVSIIMIILLCIYSVKAGFHTVTRYTAMALPAFLVILIGITLLSASIWQNLRILPPPCTMAWGRCGKARWAFLSCRLQI